ncbi:MAG: AmmeMemoRadiSam system protein B [Chitinispirillaceae bacterium]|nr:AmmeMemoRadiSam system protein B [Chitinispirillaceae bacterium]
MLIRNVVKLISCGVMMMNGLLFGVSAQDAVRKPAVAGTFYEKNPALLRTMVVRYLSGGKSLAEPARFLICPHAGFIFSGPVAGKGYATIDTNVKRVFIIGPSHYEGFGGIAVSRFDYYETPLGKVRIDRAVVEKLHGQPGVITADGFDEPEHCLEVQLPFLQVQLKDFTIVPILTGKVSPKQVADMLIPHIDAATAVIASSDLSHYERQAKARALDDATIAAILSGNDTGPIEACGETPIRIVMHLAKRLKLQPVTLDARTSYETAPQHCSDGRVVGYASIAYVSAASAAAHSPDNETSAANALGEPTPEIKKLLLELARQSLESSVRGKPFEGPGAVPAEVKENSGCFVTLTVDGALRGCIGYIEPIKPLYRAVIENAANAALHDPRFPRVTPGELKKIKIEISVLTKPVPLAYNDADDLLNKLVPKRDGVILRKGGHQSTYLPQVWEDLPDKVTFLEQLSIKGGMPRDGWKTAEVKIYRALHFEE